MDTNQYVAIFGGAAAGSEAAYQLSEKGINVVLFEQNALPYGKIENGLPKWHHKLRDRQEALIDERLNHSHIQFVPSVRLGEDLDIRDVSENWGFSVVLLATGAWKDRSLPVKGIEEFIGREFYYQNALSDWFNNNHDPNYKKYNYHIPDGSIVIGGGLASIDVAKITMIEPVRNALNAKGIPMDALTLEKKGVIPVLEELGLSLEKLGLKRSTLFTRHPIEEMPLTPLGDNPTAEELEKAGRVRRNLAEKAMARFGFRLLGSRNAVETIVEDGKLTGLIFAKDAETEGGEKTFERVLAPRIISAIGSIPEPIPGLPYAGETYRVKDYETGELEGLKNVFALGNAVTGRGNIRYSQSHSRIATGNISMNFMALDDTAYEKLFNAAAESGKQTIQSLFGAIDGGARCTLTEIDAINAKVKELQKKAGYEGDYQKWVDVHRPLRLEDMLEKE